MIFLCAFRALGLIFHLVLPLLERVEGVYEGRSAAIAAVEEVLLRVTLQSLPIESFAPTRHPVHAAELLAVKAEHGVEFCGTARSLPHNEIHHVSFGAFDSHWLRVRLWHLLYNLLLLFLNQALLTGRLGLCD